MESAAFPHQMIPLFLLPYPYTGKTILTGICINDTLIMGKA